MHIPNPDAIIISQLLSALLLHTSSKDQAFFKNNFKNKQWKIVLEQKNQNNSD